MILRRLLAIDLRSLAALRIALATVALIDLALRVPDLSAHYTDMGTLRRTDALTWFRGYHDWTFSLHLIGGSLWSQGLLFTVHASALLALLMGWRTRAAAVMSWLMFLSLTVRNPFLTYGGDVLLRTLLFWLMLVPAGGRWSVDALLSREEGSGRRDWLSIAGAGLWIQVWVVLLFAGLGKAGEEAWQSGLGLAYALDQEETTRTLGWMLRATPAVASILSHATMAIEIGGSALLLLPLWWLRMLIVASVWAMLAGIAATIDVGLFPLLMAVAMLVFLPAEAWERVASMVPAAGLAAQRIGVRVRDRILLLREKTGLALRASAPLPPRRSAARMVCEALGAFGLVYALVWNVGLRRDAAFEPPAPLAWFGRTAMMRQSWGMFAMFSKTGWFAAPGELFDGRKVDLLSAGGPVPTLEQALHIDALEQRPQDVHARYAGTHWLAIFKVMRQYPDQNGHFSYYASYLCREWNRAHHGGEELAKFQIVFFNRPVGAHPEREPVTGDYQRSVLWTHDCLQ